MTYWLIINNNNNYQCQWYWQWTLGGRTLQLNVPVKRDQNKQASIIMVTIMNMWFWIGQGSNVRPYTIPQTKMNGRLLCQCHVFCYSIHPPKPPDMDRVTRLPPLHKTRNHMVCNKMLAVMIFLYLFHLSLFTEGQNHQLILHGWNICNSCKDISQTAINDNLMWHEEKSQGHQDHGGQSVSWMSVESYQSL